MSRAGAGRKFSRAFLSNTDALARGASKPAAKAAVRNGKIMTDISRAGINRVKSPNKAQMQRIIDTEFADPNVAAGYQKTSLLKQGGSFVFRNLPKLAFAGVGVYAFVLITQKLGGPEAVIDWLENASDDIIDGLILLFDLFAGLIKYLPYILMVIGVIAFICFIVWMYQTTKYYIPSSKNTKIENQNNSS